MADQHIGYPGSVNSSQLAAWLPNAGTAQYHVENLYDGQVVANGVGDRGFTVKKGTIIGDGIMDVFENDQNMNFASVASGAPDRWDMVVLRRTWNATPGASTSVYTIIQGGPNRTLPARSNNKGVVTDQPMALARLKAGSNVVQEIVDLRTWAHNGGLIAVDGLVRNYLTELGTEVCIGTERWIYTMVKSGNDLTPYWHRISEEGTIQLYGWHNGLVGAANPSVPPQFKIQAGSLVQYSDQSGYGSVTWAKAFPNGVITVILNNGDSWATGGASVIIEGHEAFWGQAGVGSKTDVIYALAHPGGGLIPSKLHRVNYIVIGW